MELACLVLNQFEVLAQCNYLLEKQLVGETIGYPRSIVLPCWFIENKKSDKAEIVRLRGQC